MNKPEPSLTHGRIRCLQGRAPAVSLLLLCLFVFGLTGGISQPAANLSGRVTDQGGAPLPGVNVTVPGTSAGTVTDRNGDYSIRLDGEGVVRFSFLGYRTQDISPGGRTTVNVVLVETTTDMENIVVVGYGTQRKESLTGAISNIRADDIVTTKAPSLAQVLQGKVAGLNIRQENAEPGQFASSIQIRGYGGDPIYVIDGVIRDGKGEFQRLNPEDIESISFLKDGTAAIYGMNSGNGAIIVTTKKGRQERATINFHSNLSVASPTRTPKMTNAAQYLELMNEADVNTIGIPYITREELAKWQNREPGYEGVDWYDEVFNKVSLQQQHTVSVSGGNEKTDYYVSIGYAGENSMLRNREMYYDKYTFRTNLGVQILRDLRGTFNIGGRYDKVMRPYNSMFEVFKQTRENPPNMNVYANDDPDYFQYPHGEYNPVAIASRDVSGFQSEANRNIQTLFALEYKAPFIEGLSVKGQLVYDFNNYQLRGLRKAFRSYDYSETTEEYADHLFQSPSMVQRNQSSSERIDLMAQLSYNRTFASAHDVSATLVAESRVINANWVNSDRKFNTVYTIDELDYADQEDQWLSGNSNKEKYLSYIGRVNYGYRGKYLAEVAFRYDGSYRYRSDDRWAFFPMASVGWRISEEGFIRDNAPFINNLKLRASAGASAFDEGTPFQYVPGFSLNQGGYEFTDGIYTLGASSPQLIKPLTWSKVKIYDVGIDVDMFRGMLGVEFDLYQRDRTGIPGSRAVSLPNTFGGDITQENLNATRTRGFELTLSHRNSVGDFTYGFSGNINVARTQNRHWEEGEYTSSWDRWRNQNSHRYMDYVWGYTTNGQFSNWEQIAYAPLHQSMTKHGYEMPGDYRFVDTNGDGIINEADWLPLFWGQTPLVNYGISVNASWKNLDFYMLWQGAANYTVMYDQLYATMLDFNGGNTPAYFYDRWHRADAYDVDSEWIAGKWPAVRMKENTGLFYERNSDIWRKDASYIRLKTIELGYTFNLRHLSAIGISNLRLYFNANNVLTFCDSFVKPFDPEKIAGDYNAGLNYPLTKSFIFGINLTF